MADAALLLAIAGLLVGCGSRDRIVREEKIYPDERPHRKRSYSYTFLSPLSLCCFCFILVLLSSLALTACFSILFDNVVLSLV